MKKIILVICLVASISGFAKKRDTATLLTDKSIENVNFEDIARDIQVFSVKSPEPMKGIEMFYGMGDFIFGVSEDHRTVYWIKGDKVVAKLDKYGRGHGEYLYVESIAYAPEDSILFVLTSDSRLMRYQGLNCTYIGETQEFPSMTPFIAVDGRTLLANSSILGDDNNHQGLCLIDAETGKMTKEIFQMDNAQNLFFSEVLYRSGDSVVFIVPGPGKDDNKVYLYNDGRLSNLLTFNYDNKWRVPESVLIREVPANWTEDFSIVQKVQEMCTYRMNGSSYTGGEWMCCHDGRLMFWSIYSYENMVLNVVKGNKVKRYSVTMPGVDGCLFPLGTFGDYYITGFNVELGRSISDESKLTPLGKRIQQEIDKSDGDPVLVLYHIK